MELDIKIGGDSLSIPISNPFQLELDSMIETIKNFASSKGIRLDNLDIRGLIPKMVKGIAGCEKGCPADAKGLVSRGVSDFELEWHMALTNKQLAPDIEVVCLMTSQAYAFLSSSTLREVGLLGGDVSSMAPAFVVEALHRKAIEHAEDPINQPVPITSLRD